MKSCSVCKENIDQVSWKDTTVLQRFLTPTKKIAPSRQTHVCAKHQRQVARAIKRARIMALLPFVRR